MEVNERRIADPEEASEVFGAPKAGEVVRLTILRGDEVQRAEVRLGVHP